VPARSLTSHRIIYLLLLAAAIYPCGSFVSTSSSMRIGREKKRNLECKQVTNQLLHDPIFRWSLRAGSRANLLGGLLAIHKRGGIVLVY
jgi:hypothetical protein